MIRGDKHDSRVHSPAGAPWDTLGGSKASPRGMHGPGRLQLHPDDLHGSAMYCGTPYRCVVTAFAQLPDDPLRDQCCPLCCPASAVSVSVSGRPTSRNANRSES